MESLSEKDVLHVAKLAKITLTSQELKKFKKQLSEVVNYVGELTKINTEKTEPTSQTTGLENVFRLDKVSLDQSLSPQKALSGTEKTHNGYFVVPALLGERGEK